MQPVDKQEHHQLESILKRAWQVRRENFSDTVVFSAPGRTMSVSVTGNECAMNCAHCCGIYLRGMSSLKKALSSSRGEKSSYLVSGGSNELGRVPLMEHWAELKKLANRGKLNLHTGLVTEEEARRLAEIASVVSFDFVGDNDTISAVYNRSFTVDDYLESYRYLQKYTRVVPHICIGLDRGRIRGEYRALHLLKQEKVEAISMIIFRPTTGTAFSDCSPPRPEDVGRFMAETRIMFPETPLYLGCMRPGGGYRELVDVYAINAGLNKIVLPAPAARRLALDKGLNIVLSEECCSL